MTRTREDNTRMLLRSEACGTDALEGTPQGEGSAGRSGNGQCEGFKSERHKLRRGKSEMQVPRHASR